jgi:hypothetical protein
MDLPFCHSRRALAGQQNLFFCAHPRVHARGNLVTESVCRLCGYWQEPAPRIFREFTAPGADAVPKSACVYFGDLVGTKPCTTCKGSVQLKVFACHHPSRQETTLPDCEKCPDFQAKTLNIASAPHPLPQSQGERAG